MFIPQAGGGGIKYHDSLEMIKRFTEPAFTSRALGMLRNGIHGR